MNKADELYKLLRRGLNSDQTRQIAEQMAMYIGESEINALVKKADSLVSEASALRVTKSADVQAVELAQKLEAYIVAISPYRARDYREPEWAKEIQRLHNRDASFTYPVIEVVMKWLFEFESSDADFWKGNIASASKFAKQFATLLDRARKELQVNEIPTIG